MRSTFTPPSPSDSSESFFLHDPQEVIYNRVKDIFESDASVREEPQNRSNAMTVQAEIHSSSSGAASCSDDDLQMNSKDNNKKTFPSEIKEPIQPTNNHDYEDIYLVREEAKTTTKKLFGRSRSRTDSGSHSRSASTSSTRSHDVVVHTKANVTKLLSLILSKVLSNHIFYFRFILKKVVGTRFHVRMVKSPQVLKKLKVKF